MVVQLSFPFNFGVRSRGSNRTTYHQPTDERRYIALAAFEPKCVPDTKPICSERFLVRLLAQQQQQPTYLPTAASTEEEEEEESLRAVLEGCFGVGHQP